jgi:hypothetical protein
MELRPQKSNVNLKAEIRDCKLKLHDNECHNCLGATHPSAVEGCRNSRNPLTSVPSTKQNKS